MSKTERSNAEMAISEKEEGKRRAECARDRGGARWLMPAALDESRCHNNQNKSTDRKSVV